MATQNINQLDPENVKKAIELAWGWAEWQAEVNRRLTEAWVKWAKAPVIEEPTEPVVNTVDTAPTKSAPIKATTVKIGEDVPTTTTNTQVGVGSGTSSSVPSQTATNPTKTEKVADVPQITNIAQFKAAWGELDDLSNLIEFAYWAEGSPIIKWNTIYGIKNWVPTKWIIDGAWNPIATSTTRDEARREWVDLWPNMSAWDVFTALQTGQTQWLDTTTSEYEIANRRFNNYLALDKSEDWLYIAMKNNLLDYSIISELNKEPEYAEALKSANARIVREKLDDTDMKDIVNMSQMDLIEFTKNLMIKYGLDENYKAKFEENKNLQEYKDWYLESNRIYLSKKKEMDALMNKIKSENPNGSPAYINALYNIEVQWLVTEANNALAAAWAYKWSYDLEVGEMETIIDYQNLQNDKQLAFHKEQLNRQYWEFTAEAAEQRAIDRLKITDKNVNKWVKRKTADWVVTYEWLNNKWEVMQTYDSTYTWFDSWAWSKQKPTISELKDWSSIATWLDDNWVLQTEYLDSEWNEMRLSWYTNRLGSVSSLWGRVSWDNWLDIKATRWTDIPALSNVEIVDKWFDKTFWNWVSVIDRDWNKIRYAHLDKEVKWKIGDSISAWNTIWKVGNTWYTLTSDWLWWWREPNATDLAMGKGSHIDITSWDINWNIRSWEETYKFLNWWESKWSRTYSAWDINKALTRVPTTLRNAVAERENYEEIAKEALDKVWWDIWLAILDVAWWEVRGERNRVIADNLERILLTKPMWESFSFWPTSTAISSKDDYTVASWIVGTEDSALANNPTNSWKVFIDRGNVISVITKSNALFKEMENALWKDNFWQWDWRIESAKEFLWDGFFKETAKFSKFKADMENLFWDIRTERFWANLTEWEKWFIHNFMPDITDASVSIKAKIQSLKENTLLEYNSRRKATSLFEITEEELLDSLKLVEKYRNSPEDLAIQKQIEDL